MNVRDCVVGACGGSRQEVVMTAAEGSGEATIRTSIEKMRLVDEGRVEITFLIDELIKGIDLGKMRPIDSCSGCDSCN
jgi:hypothetical protein